jgi:hypothetical protein
MAVAGGALGLALIAALPDILSALDEENRAGKGSKGTHSIEDVLTKAAEFVANSRFAQTPEGKKVIREIQALKKNGKIGFSKMDSRFFAQWQNGKIVINESFRSDQDVIADNLVHEATHHLDDLEFPTARNKRSIDEELRANENELALYEEQRANGFLNSELERRRKAQSSGQLRDDVKMRYPELPENRGLPLNGNGP